jgi:hypothetical protein
MLRELENCSSATNQPVLLVENLAKTPVGKSADFLPEVIHV